MCCVFVNTLGNFELGFDWFRAVDVDNSHCFPMIFEIPSDSEIFVGHSYIVVRDDDKMCISRDFVESIRVFKDIFHPFSVKVKIFSDNFIFCHLFPPQKNGDNVANFVSNPGSAATSRKDIQFYSPECIYQKHGDLSTYLICEVSPKFKH